MLGPEIFPSSSVAELGPASLAIAAAAGLGTGALARTLGVRVSSAAAAGLAAACAALGLPERALFVAACAWGLLAVERCARAATMGERVLAMTLAAGAACVGTAAHGTGAAIVFVLAVAAWALLRTERAERSRALAAFAAACIGAAVGAVVVRSPLSESLTASSGTDFLVLGIAAITVYVVVRWRSLASESARGSAGVLGFAGVLFALLATAWTASARGVGGEWSAYVSGMSTWCVPVVVGCVLARAFDPAKKPADPSALALLAIAAVVLASRFAGVDATWSKLPILGTASAGDWSALAAVTLALYAGLALDSAPRPARARAAVAMIALAALAHALRGGPTTPIGAPRIDLDDELVGVLARPEAERASTGLEARELVLWLHPALDADAWLVVEREGAAPSRLELERVTDVGLVELARQRGAPPDAALFANPQSDHAPADTGCWTLKAEFARRGTEERLGERVVGLVHVPDRAGEVFHAALLLAVALFLVLTRPASGAGALGFCTLLALGAWLGRSL